MADKLSDAYDPDVRCGECRDKDAFTVHAIEINFAIPVEITQEQARRLHELVDEIVQAAWNQPKEGVHWQSGSGSKPHWSAADSRMLGIPVESGAPVDGEPTFDDSVFQIETSARKFVTDEERLRKNGCTWCGKLEEEHGPPGESEYAKRVKGCAALRLCPVDGVTSQFYSPRRLYA